MHTSPALKAALQRFEDLHPETIDLSLDRILNVLETLGRPQDKLPPIVHVAGTNGKGSTCAFLRAMCEAGGLSVHVFTSPHLVRFNERVRLAGQLVDDAAMVAWLDRTYQALEGRPITHFEATTAAALLAFSEVPADLLILEVGLGGRFDATNVIDTPALSVITPIDYDHQQFLGSDLAGIAAEKAGIMKTGAPVVSAVQASECAAVLNAQAARLNAPLRYVDAADHGLLPASIALPGAHQRANAVLAARALLALELPIDNAAAIHKGARSAQWPARMQRLSDGPLTAQAAPVQVWLDGGHNPHAGRALADLLRQHGGRTAMVTAMMASKDHAGYFAALGTTIDAVFTCPNAPGHAGADPKALAATAATYVPTASAYNDFDAAFQAALASKPDQVLICGSLYLAGEVLARNAEIPQ